MHEWFAESIAAGRMADARRRAVVQRLRVLDGRDLGSRATAALLSLADRGAARVRRRRTAAVAGVPACC